MKTLLNWLLTIFAIMFWIFRLVVTFMYSMNMDFIFKPFNMNIEIILLFVTVITILLIAKRKLIGGILYFLTYGGYFGYGIYLAVNDLQTGANMTSVVATFFISAIAILLSFITLTDILISKNKGSNASDKKTDWFYQNKSYDRELDERADKNNYRIK